MVNDPRSYCTEGDKNHAADSSRKEESTVPGTEAPQANSHKKREQTLAAAFHKSFEEQKRSTVEQNYQYDLSDRAS